MTTTLQALAELTGAELRGDGSTVVTALMPLEYAGASDISFFANLKYLAAAKASQAAAMITQAPFDGAPAHLLLHPEPYLAAAKVARHFHPVEKRTPGIHASAVVDAKAKVSRLAYVGPLAVIEEDACIEDGAQIHAQVFIGAGASIGKDSVINAGAKLLKGTQTGARCIVHAGAVLGADGFGFAEDKAAAPGQGRVKVPQLGIVVLGDDVEIGANTTVDRATFGMTHIGSGSKIDNLAQIGHNVCTGEDCVIVAQAGVAGSTKLGRRVVLGGQAGIVGHISLGDGVMVQAQSGVNKSIPAGVAVGGSPAVPYKEWAKQVIALRFLDEIRKLVLVQKWHVVAEKDNG